jgi:hypothetical protein
VDEANRRIGAVAAHATTCWHRVSGPAPADPLAAGGDTARAIGARLDRVWWSDGRATPITVP